MHRTIAAAAFGAEAPATPDMKAVLVTGASSGIGRKITERLAAAGCLVYAGARKDADLQALGSMRNVRPVRLDVNKPQEIEAARDAIEQGGHGLYGLVNNAGVLTTGRVVTTTMAEFDTVISTNVYGPWRITRAFAPLLIAARGRVVNISSVSGIVSYAETGAYSMSKFAVEAFTDALAQEMAPLGVQVSAVEPGTYRSNIIRNEVQRSGTGGQYLDYAAQAKEPDEVAAAVEQALFEPGPRLRYLVVPNEEEARIAIGAQIQRLVELNERQRYSYDRDALVKLLDEALHRTPPQGR